MSEGIWAISIRKLEKILGLPEGSSIIDIHIDRDVDFWIQDKSKPKLLVKINQDAVKVILGCQLPVVRPIYGQSGKILDFEEGRDFDSNMPIDDYETGKIKEPAFFTRTVENAFKICLMEYAKDKLGMNLDIPLEDNKS